MKNLQFQLYQKIIGENKMNEIKVFEGLKVKEENGQVMFDAETAAIGLGISTVAKSGNAVVRWTRVNQYLGLSNSGQFIKRGDFITEPQFYKLAIKANNETAEKFQDWVTSEVLPSIRKTGSYQARPLTAMETITLHSKAFVEVDQRLDNVTEKVDTYIDNQPVNATDYGAIGVAVTRRVHAYGSIHHIPKENRRPLFKDLNSQIKQVTGAGNRSRIRSKDYDKVIQFIDNWEPSTATKTLIHQQEFDLGDN